jgi:hypothetical protein
MPTPRMLGFGPVARISSASPNFGLLARLASLKSLLSISIFSKKFFFEGKQEGETPDCALLNLLKKQLLKTGFRIQRKLQRKLKELHKCF